MDKISGTAGSGPQFHHIWDPLIASYLSAVADLGFLEGGFCCTLAREILEATPIFDRFESNCQLNHTSPIDRFLNEFSAKAC